LFYSKDRLEFRREVEDSKDFRSEEIDSENNDDEPDESEQRDSNAVYDGIDLNLELNLTIKSLELLGQLSRNYYGSLKIGQKNYS
jgi:hypothetical protein